MKKKQQDRPAANNRSSTVAAKAIAAADRIPFLFLLLYAIAEILPGNDTADVIGNQWLYVSLVNLAALIYLAVRKDQYDNNSVYRAGRNIISLVFGLLFIVSVLSIFSAFNKTESVVVLARMFNTLVMVFVLAVGLRGRTQLLRWLAIILSALLFVQSIQVILQFFKGVNEQSALNQVIYGLKLNTGNKNILAAQLVFKSAMALYCVHTARSVLGKVLFSLILFPAALAVFILNARAAYISLFLVLIFFTIVSAWLQYRKAEGKQLLLSVGAPVLAVIAAFLLSGPVLRNAMSGDVENAAYGTVAERLGSIELTAEGSNARILQWKDAMDYISLHPLTGAGYGNWKFVSIPYERSYANDLQVAYHVHNDFLELTAETGIAGGLLFLALFFSVLVVIIKLLVRKDERSHLALLLLAGLIAYAVDAFFNFPMERTVMQFYFALVLGAAASISFSTEDPVVRNKRKWILIPLLLLLVPSIYIAYQSYKSYKAQATVNKDVLQAVPQNKFDEIRDRFPSIPNINAYAFPIDHVKALYLINEKRYEEALQYADKGNRANPYLGLTEYLKGRVYYETDKLDSALIFARKAFEIRPRAKSNYELVSFIYLKRKDSAGLTGAFREFIHYRNEPAAWNSYIVNMLNINANRTRMSQLLDSAIRIFPADADLQNTRKNLVLTPVGNNVPVNNTNAPVNNNTAIIANTNTVTTGTTVQDQFNSIFIAAMTDFNNKEYSKAIEKFKNAYKVDPQYYCLENVGVCYYTMGKYPEAAEWFSRSIKTGKGTDGKSEFFRAMALLNLGNNTEACNLLRAAEKKKFPDARKNLDLYCK